MVAEHRLFYGRLDYVHRTLARLIDRRYPIDERILVELLDYVEHRDLRFIEALVRRGLGVLHGRTDQLREALVGFERSGARPFVARAQTELGRIVGDEGMLATGLRELERLGDLDQLDRALAESRQAKG